MQLRFFSLYSKIFIFSFIALGVFLPLKVKAVDPSSILVDMAPENPAPNENVNITLSSYTSSLDSVLITWFVNGKDVLSGVGEKSFSVNAPNAGEGLTISVSIHLPNGQIDRTIVVRPSVMVLLWQANDSYVPPFYRGKALPVEESEIKIVALPEARSGSKIIDPKNLTYFWKKNYNNEQDSSGYGKNFFTYTNDYLDDSNNISVTASTPDQAFSSEGSIDVKTTKPKIIFYKRDPALGTLWEKAMGDGHIVTGEEIIEEDPYFISPKDIRTPSLDWKWYLNDSLVENTRRNLLPVKVDSAVSGTSKIKLSIENLYQITEALSGEINVQF